MFNAKSKSDSGSAAQGGNSLIGAGTTIKGDIVSSGDVRIDGTLVGNIRCTAKVLIGQDGVVEGDIEGQQADILGKVTGKIHVTELLNLRGVAIIRGNLRAGKLQIEPTVTFNGQCHMGKEASVVEMDTEEYPKAIAK
ncbi:MAG: polymer-forming cytoskeletal protein [Chitinophagaceae bacterium]|jgi:cytoskeletal protein CcmA (bactofilin family)|nr:polymer-forming cytoskeletal protein [Chitinophagaceae bacterium]